MNATSVVRPLAVITGASSGIGYELPKVFAEEGYDLLVCAEDPGIVEARQAFEQLGGRVESVRADLAQPDGVAALYGAVRAFGRPVDTLVVNAGVGVGGPFVQTDLQEELNLINLNITGAVHLTKLVLRDMAERGEGKLLFVSSVAATMPGPFEAVYAASKAFLYSFAEALRNELKDSGITVTAMMPGPTETNFFHRAHMDDTKAGTSKKDDPELVARKGYEALIHGDDHVLSASMKTRIQGVLAKFLSRTTAAAAHRAQTEPGSGHKH